MATAGNPRMGSRVAIPRLHSRTARRHRTDRLERRDGGPYSSGMRIRRAEHRDIEAVLRVHRASIRELSKLHYTRRELDGWVEELGPESITSRIDAIDVFVAIDETDAVVGFGMLDPAQREVLALYVHPSAARAGVGKNLLRRLEEAARERHLDHVHLSASLNSSDFYYGAGYEFDETVKHRLRSGTEIRCIQMSKSLDGRARPVRPEEMPVFLVPYDESWPRKFEDERNAISLSLGHAMRGVEHIGSTAIPGMAAKPVIDVLVLVDDISDAPGLFDPLERLEYHYFPYEEIRTPERRWFYKPNRLHRTHHLHLTELGSRHHRNQIAFRDHLRAHREDARRYEALKRELALRFPRDREAYTDGKSAFVASVLAKAGAR